MRHQQTYSGDRVLEQETRTTKVLEEKLDKQIVQTNCLIQRYSGLALIIFLLQGKFQDFFHLYNMLCCAYLQFIAKLNRLKIVQQPGMFKLLNY